MTQEIASLAVPEDCVTSRQLHKSTCKVPKLPKSSEHPSSPRQECFNSEESREKVKQYITLLLCCGYPADTLGEKEAAGSEYTGDA